MWDVLTILTSEFVRVTDFSPYVIFAVSLHRICDLTEAMIDNTLIAFNLCRHKKSLPSILRNENLLQW